MANRYDDRERRWRDEDRRDDEDRGESRWRRPDWRDEDRQNRYGRERFTDQEDDWMTYGRPFEEARYGGRYDYNRQYEYQDRGYEGDPDDELYGRETYGRRRGYGRGEDFEGDRDYESYGRQPYRQRRDVGRDRDFELYGRRRPQRETDYGRGFKREGSFGRPYDYQQYERRGERDYGRSRNQERNFQTQYEEDYWDEPTTSTWTYSEYWLVPGPYTGISPKNYQRSDERILDDVCDRMTRHGHLDARNIEIEVNKGEVTLKGTVTDRESKRMAEDITDSVFGVHDVHNQLKVEHQRSQQRFGRGQMHSQVNEGMEVFGTDGEKIGDVKKVRQNDILVDRTMARDVYVPFREIKFREGKLFLTIPSHEVDNQNWEVPEIIETPDLGQE